MPKRQLLRAAVGFALYLFLVPALLFIAAGTVRWPMAWVHVALLLASTLGSRLIVYRRNPETLRERARFTSAEGMKRWDRILVMIVGLYGPLATTLVAGLDRRWGWSGDLPAIVQLLGALATAAGYGWAVWAMVANPYFSSVARIQADRGQRVVTTGPYRIVRHPSYAGALVAAFALPFMLGALWALIPAALLGATTVVRTALEDRMLRSELDGYARYAAQTRYRLIPGVW
ncbi:MAG: isoprenylcysteine carboxylmethyltransferase family protein [Anaerolineae bacterium]|nr:isoprenylcysteine carboxylmethyltransferase family protein [Anaerolineae bacterium]